MAVIHGRGRTAWILLVVVALAFSGCGDDGGDGGESDGSSGGGGEAAITSEEVCGLLSQSEVEELVGRSITGQELTSEPGGSDSPYPSCSWHTGRLIVQVAPGDSIVLAPGEDCPSIDVGDEGVECPGSVQFVVGDARVIVQTIEDVTDDQLVAVADALAPKFGG